MNEPRRRRSIRRPRRARSFDVIINLCLVLAAVLAALPWLFFADTDTPPGPRNAAQAVAARGLTANTNDGATR